MGPALPQRMGVGELHGTSRPSGTSVLSSRKNVEEDGLGESRIDLISF